MAVTDWARAGHSLRMGALDPAAPEVARPDFQTIYDEHVEFVWRVVRRLGVPDGSVDDAVQDVFVVVHRRLDDFQGRSSVRTWLFGIARRVARDHRRRDQRRGGTAELPAQVAARAPDPRQAAEDAEAVHALHGLLAALPDEQREVFVLAELEQMTAPEIAEATGAKLNTVYSRLRLARAAFNRGAAALQGGGEQ